MADFGGHRSRGRRASRLSLAIVSVISGCLGGALAGAAAGYLGGVLPFAARISLATAAATLLPVAAVVSPRRLPQFNRETDQSLLGHGPFVWAAVNSFLLGLGFASRIGYWLFYVMPIGCLALGSPAGSSRNMGNLRPRTTSCYKWCCLDDGGLRKQNGRVERSAVDVPTNCTKAQRLRDCRLWAGSGAPAGSISCQHGSALFLSCCRMYCSRMSERPTLRRRRRYGEVSPLFDDSAPIPPLPGLVSDR